MSRPAVVIVGAGLHGCALAFELAERGADVVVIERGIVGAEASSAAAGMLAPTAEACAHPGGTVAHAIGVDSLARYPAWLARVQAASGMAVSGAWSGIVIDERRCAPGVALEGRLTGRELAAIEPNLAIDHAFLIPGEGWVDPVELVAAVAQAALNVGVRFVRGEVRAVAEGAVTIGAEGGELRLCGEVVVCAGAWTARVPGLATLPVEPVRGQILALDAQGCGPSRVVFAPGCYLVPRHDGRVLVGSTMERVGFERGVTPEGIAALSAAAVLACPGLAGAARIGAWSGFRPGTPDGLPVMGRWQGVWVASGHHRNGILLAPYTAAVMAGALLHGVALHAALDPGRFARSAA